MSINKNYSNKPKVQASHTHSNKPIREALHILNEMSLYVRHDKKNIVSSPQIRTQYLWQLHPFYLLVSS